MRTTTERTRGVMMTKLDLAPLLVDIPVDDDHTAGLGHEPYAMFEHNHRLYVVCSEGVGWEVSSSSPLPVDVYLNRPGFISVCPKYQMLLSPDEVRGRATDETVDLADLVRVFGPRLESNFRSWHRALTR